MHPTFPLLAVTDFPKIRRGTIETLQVNLGYRCNQSCVHCHVNAGPSRTEEMSAATVNAVIAFLDASPKLARGTIRVADHCYGCTAGRGSSCGGALADARTEARSCAA